MKTEILDCINENIRLHEELRESIDAIENIAREAIDVLLRGGKIVLFGNGGSASDAQHIATELIGRFQMERRPLPALALTTNTSTITAIANDSSFDRVFIRQVEALVDKKDLVVGISTSGDSANVLKGIGAAKRKGARTVGLTGKDGGNLAKAVDLSVRVPSTKTPRIQESHITIGHILCQLIEGALFRDKKWAVFLDRDGGIIRDVKHLHDPSQLALLPRARRQ